MKELGGETVVLLRMDLPLVGGGIEAGVETDIGAIVWVRGETFEAESETADLWQPTWNENQTVLAAAIHTPDRDANPLEGVVAGSWGLGIVEQSQERAAIDHGEMDRRDVTGETVVGNACGGKPESHGSKVILLSHTYGVEPSP